MDILDDFREIKIATAYEVDGQILDSFPADLETLSRANVVYKTMPGWQTPTTGAKSYSDLPARAREYVEFIEDFVQVKVKWIVSLLFLISPLWANHAANYIQGHRTGEGRYDCKSVTYLPYIDLERSLRKRPCSARSSVPCSTLPSPFLSQW